MNHMTKRFAQAVEAVRMMPPDQQDLLAVELMERAEAFALPVSRLSAEERVELEAELAAARRGELASEAEVAAMFAKHGL